MSGLLDLTAVELGKKIQSQEVTAIEALDEVFGQIDKREKEIHAYVTIDREAAYKRAADVQKEIESGNLTNVLAGVPVAIKDNICTKGLLTTCSSKI